ncbi:DUF3131 domain-containing protein [Rubellimicrobium roseum]|uniref:DUF3131 domain-containing protein n=1 Tax=Rubellimicrobium roseum TaxID=687525 RepID=A0A5C4N9G2_9RHOB|nr:DUF3131 domain-containing protein [Rubellimicrobium roseum]TNC66570.1 DUF3131 domain-containing protein [Rubellimicrobium roseum]
MIKTASAALLAVGLTATLASPAAAADEPWPERPLATSTPIASPRHGPLTEEELAMARQAWRYFEVNWQPDTGLANSVMGYPVATLWDTASYLAAIVAASEFEIITMQEADERLELLLTTLAHLELYRQDCPNKAYDTRTAFPTDYNNNPGEIGCSALDMGRLMVWLKIVEQRHHEFEPLVRRTLRRWNWCGIMGEPGVMRGATVAEDGTTVYLQEGRLGYEEYAASGFALWGFGVDDALKPEPFETTWLHGVEVPHDSRDLSDYGAHNSVVTEGYALYGMEFGWSELDGDTLSAWVGRAAQNIYEVQHRRHQATGILTARSEHQLLDDPYFVYDSIFSNDEPWATITEDGRSVPAHAAVSLKGALGLWALWDTPYTDELFDAIATQFEPEFGFHEGLYEDGRGPILQQTANNNGIILETLLFKVEGPLLRPESDPAGWLRTSDSALNRCLPGAPPTPWTPADQLGMANPDRVYGTCDAGVEAD